MGLQGSYWEGGAGSVAGRGSPVSPKLGEWDGLAALEPLALTSPREWVSFRARRGPLVFPLCESASLAMVRAMKFSLALIFLALQALQTGAFAGNSVVNLSHYDLMRPDFVRMREQGIVGIIHEASYPRYVMDEKYAERQHAAVGAGLLWGAYHFADASSPVRQADHFLSVVESSWRRARLGGRPNEVLLVLDFEKNGHYPGGTMGVEQAAQFVERIRERTGRYPGLYGSEYRLQRIFSAPSVRAADRAVLSRCWLWVANYHHTPGPVPPWNGWRMWQYTGDGVCELPRASYPTSIANIRKAERNMFRGDTSALREFWQANGWQPGLAAE